MKAGVPRSLFLSQRRSSLPLTPPFGVAPAEDSSRRRQALGEDESPHRMSRPTAQALICRHRWSHARSPDEHAGVETPNPGGEGDAPSSIRGHRNTCWWPTSLKHTYPFAPCICGLCLDRVFKLATLSHDPGGGRQS